MLGFAINIFILCCFKYLAFLVANLNEAFEILQFPINLSVPQLLLPLGLSFIIFQATTYLGDVYHGKVQATDILSVACFVAFFPTILSGPIQKANKLILQLQFDSKWNKEKFVYGLLLLLCGYFEKIFVADKLAAIVDPVLNNYINYSAVFLILAAALYSIQIYVDFLAYSDLATGISAMLGVTLSKNFSNPYLSENLVEFWKNWHISLNEWFVEYIYIPLGGSRRGYIRKYLNTFIVFTISGLWHGAQWNFVAWGAINGLLQIVGQVIRKPKEIIMSCFFKEKTNSVILPWCRRLIVFIIISTTWIFFRMPTLEDAFNVLHKICYQSWIQIFDQNGWMIFGTIQSAVGILLSLIIFLKLQMARREEEKIVNVFCKEAGFVQQLVIAVAWVIILICLCQQFTNPNNTFIYFQF